MSKQYMDFAPRKATRSAAPSRAKAASGARPAAVAKAAPVRAAAARPKVAASAARPAGARAVAGVKAPARPAAVRTKGPAGARTATEVKPVVARAKVAKKPTAAVTKAVKKPAMSVKNEPALGVVEDLKPKFVNTNVPKRPLGEASHFRTKKTGVAAAKARKIGARAAASVEKPVENSKKTGSSGIYSTPKSPFINQGKVAKRPLSKNVYQKKIATPKEEPKGPVTIISKPEKQANVGLIVTVILTIILGAAAGTVAFLLLPK